MFQSMMILHVQHAIAGPETMPDNNLFQVFRFGKCVFDAGVLLGNDSFDDYDEYGATERHHQSLYLEILELMLQCAGEELAGNLKELLES